MGLYIVTLSVSLLGFGIGTMLANFQQFIFRFKNGLKQGGGTFLMCI